MRIFFAAEPLGFYDTEIHGEPTILIADPAWVRPTKLIPDPAWEQPSDNAAAEPPMIEVPDTEAEVPLVPVRNPACGIPESAVEVSASRYAELRAAISAGKILQAQEDGTPVVVDPPPPTLDEIAAIATAKRDALLQQSDALVLRAMESGSPVPSALIQYRTDLRDLPTQPGWPTVVDWPEVPAL